MHTRELPLAAIVQAVPTAIVMVDGKGTIVLVNKHAEQLFGYVSGELVGAPIEILVPQRFRGDHANHRSEFIAHPEARPMGAGRDLFGVRKDGSEFPIEIGLNPVRTSEGFYVLSAVVDISERVRHAEEMRVANEALERSNIELQRFAYVASHDLQAPMRTIAGFIELLQLNYAEKLDDRARDWIHRAVQSTRRLQSLMQDLLDYSRIDSQPRPFEDIAFDEVVDQAIALLGAQVSEQNVSIAREALPHVSGDRSQLVQLMLNLLSNAIKYRSRNTPTIVISARADDGRWIISVADNGIGIECKHHQKIFDIFQRLHTQHEFPGTGIGLAVARRVVARHSGRIWVESEPGAGSTFHFTLPQREHHDDPH